MQVTGESRRTITENAAKVVTNERRFLIDEVMLQDVLDRTNIVQPKLVLLKQDQRERSSIVAETYVEESLELEDVSIVGHPFSFRVAAVGLCRNLAEMTLEPVWFVWAGDHSER
jgi:hypothetical protein